MIIIIIIIIIVNDVDNVKNVISNSVAQHLEHGVRVLRREVGK